MSDLRSHSQRPAPAHWIARRLPSIFSKPIQIDLPISHAGAFVYWIEYDAPGKSKERVKGREGYFNVDPVLTIQKRNSILSADDSYASGVGGGVIPTESVKIPLDGLAILTEVSKWMGTLEEWAPHLKQASDRGYNMIHYTPLQQRGVSKSPYSIADQLAFDEELFEAGCPKEEGVKRVATVLKDAKKDLGLLSLIDVVLNHTANNSAWLVDHPEAGYSPANTPHLAPALVLDDCIVDFSENIAAKGLPTNVHSQSDLDAICGALEKEIKALDLWQYYVIDVVSEKEAVKAALETGGAPAAWDGPEIAGKTVAELAQVLKDTGKITNLGALSSRFCVTVDPAVAASFVSAAFVELKEPAALAEAWGRVLDVFNVDLYKEWEEDTRVANEGIRNRVKYTRLDDHGPKWGPITRE